MKRIASLLPLVLLLVSLPLLGADSFEQLVKDYSAPQSGPTSQSPAFQFEFGNLKVDFSGGSIAPILAGSKPIGLFLKGAGEIAYRSVDPIEHPVLQTNVKHSTRLRADKDGAALLIRDTFTEALFLAAGPVKLPAVGEAGESLQSDWETHRGFFARDLSAPASHLFVIQNADAPDRAVLRAQFRGGKENLVYLYDDVVTRSESLVALMELSRTQVGTLREFLFPAILSDQPIKRDRRDPLPARLGLTNLKYDLTAATNRDASLSTEQTFVPLVSQQILRLDLYDVVYEDQEKPPRRLNLRRVVDERGTSLPFHHFRDEVIVRLSEPAPAGKPFRLKFEIDGDFLIRPRNSSFWQLTTEPWYPQPELAGLLFQVQSTVRVEKPYIPFTPGTTVARRTEGKHNVVESRIDVPIHWAVVHAGSYVVKEETRNGVTVRIATYAMGNPRAAKELTELTFNAVSFFEPFLGPFPFREFNIIQVDSYGYGQAPPGTMFITHEAFTSVTDELSRLFSEGINERFLHEIAHQYWGNVVGFPAEEEQWLSEAFAEYSAALALRATQGEGVYKRMLNTWRTNGRQASPVSTIPLVNRISMPRASGYERWAMRHWLLYQKGPYLLAVLHKEIGDEAFLTFLKSYQASFRWKLGNTKHVVGLLKAITKKDFTPFFEDYFWGTKMPEMPR